MLKKIAVLTSSGDSPGMLGQNGHKINEVLIEKAAKHHQQLSHYLLHIMEVLTI